MFTYKRKNGGNRSTFVSIVMILAVICIFRLVSPHKEAVYPGVIQYDNLRYQYVETVKGSPFMYARKRPTSDEGYIILARRGISIFEEVYIYEGYLKYRRYVVLKE